MFNSLFKPNIEKLAAKGDIKGLVKVLDDQRAYIRQGATEALVKIGPSAVDDLILVVQEGSRDARPAAVETLGKIGDTRAVEPLIYAFENDDQYVRLEIARALGLLGDIRAVIPLSNALNDPYVTEAAAESLIRMGAPSFRHLMAALKKSDNSVRQVVLTAISSIRDPQVVPEAVAALQDVDVEVRNSVTRALVTIGAPSVEALIHALKTDQGYAHRALVETLVLIHTSAIPSLMAALKSEHWNVRLGTAEALGKIGDLRAIDPLRMALMDGNVQVRQAAAAALGALNWQPGQDSFGASYWISKGQMSRCSAIGEPAVEPLIEAFKSGDKNVRQDVAEVLVTLGAAAVVALSGLLKENNKEIRAEAAKALVTIGPASVEPLIGLLRDGEAHVRQTAVEALAQIEAAPITALLEMVADGDGDVLVSTVGALGKLGMQPKDAALPSRIAEALVTLLHHSQPAVRDAAASALAKLNWQPVNDAHGAAFLIFKGQFDACVAMGAVALEPLLNALQRDNDDHKMAAIEALIKLDARLENPADHLRVIEALTAALKNENPLVRWAAVDGLAHLGASSAVELISAMLMDVAEEVCEAATAALDDLKWQPGSDATAARYWVIKGQFAACLPIGAPAIQPLMAVFRSGDDHKRYAAAETLAQIGAPAFEALSAALKEDDRAVRRGAAQALGQPGDPRVIPLLIAALEDADVGVRLAATQALLKTGDERGLTAIIAAFKKGLINDRKVASGALRQMNTTHFIEPLLAELSHSDANVRQMAVRILDFLKWQPGKDEHGAFYWIVRGQFDTCIAIGKPAFEPLVAALRWYKGNDVIRALVKLDGERAWLPLSALLKDGDVFAREAAAQALGELGNPQAVNGLTEALKDEDSDVRFAAAGALLKIGVPSVLPLVRALNLNHHRARPAAANVLIKIGAPAVGPLIAALKNMDEGAGEVAIGVLHKIGAPSVAPLIMTLKDRDPLVQKIAASALEKLNWQPGKDEYGAIYWIIQRQFEKSAAIGVPAFEPLCAALTQKDLNMRKAAAETLGRLGDLRAVQALIAVLNDADKDVRAAAAGALVKFGTPSIVPLLAALKDDFVNGRQGASGVLEQLKWHPGKDENGATYWIIKGQINHCVEIGTPAVKPLIDVLAGFNKDFRRDAARVLGQINDPRAIEPLTIALRDDEGIVREAAAQALEALKWRPGKDARGAAYWVVKRQFDTCIAIGGPAVDPLISALFNKDWSSREGAARALVSIYRSSGVNESIKQMIFAKRENIIYPHQDTPGLEYDGCWGHWDSPHEDDGGIGVDFPL